MTLTRRVTVEPYRDERSENPDENKGVTGVVFNFSTKGLAGETTLRIQTNWVDDATRQTFIEQGNYHFLAPWATLDHIARDGTKTPSTRADHAMFALMYNGDERAWEVLERAHNEVFPGDASFEPVEAGWDTLRSVIEANGERVRAAEVAEQGETRSGAAQAPLRGVTAHVGYEEGGGLSTVTISITTEKRQ